MSRRAWQAATLVCATVTTGLTAGVFADWAHTIMPGLGRTDDRTFVSTLQALDHAIFNAPFLLCFIGAQVLTGVAAALHLRGHRRRGLPWVAAAFCLYLLAFAVTMTIHEPLNVAVRHAGTAEHIADPSAVRAAFDEFGWAAWHIVRTIATCVAFGCLTWALVLHGRTTADHRAGRGPIAPDRPPEPGSGDAGVRVG